MINVTNRTYIYVWFISFKLVSHNILQLINYKNNLNPCGFILY